MGFPPLVNNKLTTLPESFGNLKSLRELYLDVNQLTTLSESFLKLVP
ncbi:MAG: leucine-rich repeat domain-containing protein, partial [Candidatus Helarchaeota archaeon]